MPAAAQPAQPAAAFTFAGEPAAPDQPGVSHAFAAAGTAAFAAAAGDGLAVQLLLRNCAQMRTDRKRLI